MKKHAMLAHVKRRACERGDQTFLARLEQDAQGSGHFQTHAFCEVAANSLVDQEQLRTGLTRGMQRQLFAFVELRQHQLWVAESDWLHRYQGQRLDRRDLDRTTRRAFTYHRLDHVNPAEQGRQ